MADNVGAASVICDVMRFRNITFATIAAVALALIAVFVPRGVQEVPQVRLLRLTRKAVEPAAWLGGTSDGLIVDALDSQQESWSAEFEVHNPAGSGILLSDSQIGVEMLGASGDWTAAVIPQSRALLEFQSLMRIETRRTGIKLSVPSGTRCCRFAIRFRPLTLQERCRQVLAKCGFWRRCPNLSAWTSDRAPGSRRWREYRPEVMLPSVLVQPGAHNEPLQRTAGLRFSQFVAQWPAAAEFWCWMISRPPNLTRICSGE
jgi:hypothetical protein